MVASDPLRTSKDDDASMSIIMYKLLIPNWVNSTSFCIVEIELYFCVSASQKSVLD